MGNKKKGLSLEQKRERLLKIYYDKVRKFQTIMNFSEFVILIGSIDVFTKPGCTFNLTTSPFALNMMKKLFQ